MTRLHTPQRSHPSASMIGPPGYMWPTIAGLVVYENREGCKQADLPGVGPVAVIRELELARRRGHCNSDVGSKHGDKSVSCDLIR
ncbi:hypothetical protein GXC69_09015 [Candidatus Macondimonas diazotrophica]|jgi:hypothetical protein|nr:hypothetical protein [Candidatus Macondimonas diazotrophica]HBG29497.1 hypothetical protein [Gammaproteobacteria bacterium]